ncbi:hypothetical protein VNO78_04199 [Psophocarpus tetragonolobus]|uniref:Uncharacterized protein n=1 Tax=Psophocarpus tetragonolobus TaxID=3891 RepID=A0AAN9XWI8_PSOTE
MAISVPSKVRFRRGCNSQGVMLPLLDAPRLTFPRYYKPGENFKDQLRMPITILRSRNGLQCELQCLMARLKASKVVETKWNPNVNDTSTEFIMIHSRKLPEGKNLVDDEHKSFVSILLEQLLQARKSNNKLKLNRIPSKKCGTNFAES